MWIFCGGMYRSGSTLQYQITVRLVEEAKIGHKVDWVKPEEFPQLARQNTDNRGLKVFKCHVCTDAVVEEFEKKNAKGVYIFRDIRDVAASYMRKYEVDFAGMLRSHILERSLENYCKWTSLPNVSISQYERVIPDLPSEVEKIAVHIGAVLEKEKYREIAEEFSLDKQLRRIEEFKRKADREKNGKSQIFDPDTMLHTNHITSTSKENWQQSLKREEVAYIEELAKEWLRKHDYKLLTTR